MRRAEAWAILWGLIGAAAINTGAITVAALGTTIEHDLGITHTLLGVIQMGFFVGSAGGSLLFGMLLRRVGLKHTAILALSLAIVGSLFSSLPYLVPLMAGRVCIGVAVSIMGMFAGSVVVHAFPDRQHALLNLLHAAFIIGSGIGMLITVPLVSLLGAWWRVPPVLGALLLIPLTGLAALPHLPQSGTSALAGRAALRDVLRQPALYRTAIVIAGYILAETAFILFFPVYAQELGRNRAAAANTIAVFLAGILVGRLFIASTGGPGGGARTTLTLVASSGAALLLSVLSPSLPLATVLLFLGGVLGGPTAPLAISLAVHRIRDHRNEVLALTNLSLCASGLTASVLAGAWSDTFSVRTALGLSAGLFLLCFLPLIGFGQAATRGKEMAPRK